MWWLLNRYEYLFVGLLPEQADQIIVTSRDQDDSSSSSPLARPHWGESNLINPPPAAATLPEPKTDDIPGPSPSLIDPQPVGSFVDLIA